MEKWKGAWGIVLTSQRYRTAGAGQGKGSKRGANLREILSRVSQDFPQGRTKPADRTRGRGAHRDPPLPCLSLGTSVLASAGCPSNRCSPTPPVPAPVPTARTLTPESRSHPPQPLARAPPPQHGQKPLALSASGLGRAHWCARPFPPSPGPRVAANVVALRLPVPGHRRVDAATGEEPVARRYSPRVAAGPAGPRARTGVRGHGHAPFAAEKSVRGPQ